MNKKSAAAATVRNTATSEDSCNAPKRLKREDSIFGMVANALQHYRSSGFIRSNQVVDRPQIPWFVCGYLAAIEEWFGADVDST